MKKLACLLAILVFASSAVFANEDNSGKPEQKFDDNRAVVSVQKQPASENQKQGIRRNWFCIIVQVNGKVSDSAASLSDTKQ